VQVLNYFVGVVVALLLTPFLIGKLGDYYYGIWILISTIVGYFALSEFGVGSALQNHLSICLGKNDPDEYRIIFSNGFFLYFLISAVVFFLVAISLLTVLLLESRFAESHLIAGVMVIIGVNLSISFVFYPYVAVLKSHIRLDVVAWVEVLKILMTAALMVVVLTLGYGLRTLALVTLVASLCSNFVFLSAARRVVPRLGFQRGHLDRNELKSLLIYSGKTFLAQIGDILRFKVDEVVTAAFISVNHVAHYAVANKLATMSNKPSLRFLGILSPLLAQYVGREDEQKLKERFLLGVKVTGAFSVFVYSGLIILGEPFIRRWLGPSYIDSYAPLVILGGAFLMIRTQSTAISLMYAKARHHYYAFMNLSEGVANLGLSILFVKYFGLGINGVALGTLIPTIITRLFIQPMIAARLVKMAVIDYYALVLRIFLLGALIYGPMFLARSVFALTMYWQLGIAFAILSGLFLVHVGLLLNREERTLVSKSIREWYSSRAE